MSTPPHNNLHNIIVFKDQYHNKPIPLPPTPCGGTEQKLYCKFALLHIYHGQYIICYNKASTGVAMGTGVLLLHPWAVEPSPAFASAASQSAWTGAY